MAIERAPGARPVALVVAACAWVAALLAPHLRGANATSPLAGDALPPLAAHVHALARALAAGDGDLWLHGANLGSPAGVFAPLVPSLAPAGLAALGVDVHLALKLALAAPLALLPLALYAGLRGAPAALRLDPVRAAAAAACAALALSGSPFGLGVEGAFGRGLLDEAWATLFVPVAAAWGARFVVEGGAFTRALLAATACALCHPLLAAALVLPWGLACLGAPAAKRLARGALLAAATLAASAVAWLPALVTWPARGAFGPHLHDGDGGFAPARFVWFVATALDGARAPVLTALALAGVLTTAWALVRAPVGGARGEGDGGRGDGGAGAAAAHIVVAAAGCVALLVGPLVSQALGGAAPFGRAAIVVQLSLCALAGVGLVDVVAGVARLVPFAARGALFARSRPPVLPLVARAALAVCVAALAVIAGAGQLQRAEALLRTVDEDGAFAADLSQLQRIVRRHEARARLGAAGRLRTVARHATAFDDWPGVWSSLGASVPSSAMARFADRDDVVAPAALVNAGLILVAADAPAALRPPPPLRPRGAPPARAVVRAGRFDVHDTGVRSFFLPVLLEAPLAPLDDAAFRARTQTWWDAQGWRTGRHLVWRHAPAPAGRGAVQIVDEDRGPSWFSADVDVAADGPRAVLLKASWHPWWRATVDGQPVPALRAAPDMVAAELPPGMHALRFSFVRPWWWWALWLAPLLVPLLGTLVAGRRLARRA